VVEKLFVYMIKKKDIVRNVKELIYVFITKIKNIAKNVKDLVYVNHRGVQHMLLKNTKDIAIIVSSIYSQMNQQQ
jgi:hypothetical protein